MRPVLLVAILMSVERASTHEAACDVVWKEGDIFVNCSYRLLTSFSSSFPSDTVWLDLSHNKLSDLNATSPQAPGFDTVTSSSNQMPFLGLSRLKRLDLSYNSLNYIPRQAFLGLRELEELLINNNKIVHIHPHAFQGLVTMVTLCLDDNNIQTIQPEVLYNLTKLQNLDIGSNEVTKVSAGNFSPLQQLRVLRLNNNKITTLEPGAFTGLKKLLFLNLSSNGIVFDNQTLPPDIFKPLKSLTELYLHENGLLLHYPDRDFQPLVSLQILSVDTFSKLDFGPGFASMKELRVLILDSSSCQVQTITNRSFEVFHNSALEEIHLSGCLLEALEACAFCFLPHLKVLRLGNNPSLSLNNALSSLYGLQGQNMTLVDFSGMYNLFSTGVIGADNGRYLQNICARKVSLSGNRIQIIETSFLASPDMPFVKCIEDLDISYNRIVGERMSFFKLFALATKLVSFRMDQQYTLTVADALCMTVDDSCKRQATPSTENLTLYFTFPPSLSYANFSGMRPVTDAMPRYMNFYRAHGLRVLDLSNNRFSYCVTTLLGLEALEWLSIRASNCYILGETVFDYCKQLQHLDLSYLNLNPLFFYQRAWRVLGNLSDLKELLLNSNNLLQLHPYMLRAQPKLKSLTLANNRLTAVSLDLRLHQNLTLLDVSYNMLATLSSDVRQALDELASRHVISLRLRGNPIVCACSNLDFVLWLSTTKVSLDADDDNGVPGNLTCLLDSGDVSNTAQVLANYDDHWRRCVGSTALGVAVSCFLVQLLGLLAALTVSRSWTHIRYYWKVMCRLRLPRREDYEWDAFLLYADDNLQTVSQTVAPFLEGVFGIRLRIPDRDDLPGSYIAENVVTNIENSWKVLLLVTAAFTTDEWCGFTVLQAQRSIRDTMPDRVLVVFLEDPAFLDPLPALNRLLGMIPNSCVFHVPHYALTLHETWESVAQAIVDDSKQTQ